ncbi:MAG: HlyD family secretion protein, partial [Armatimonadota bacterium]
VSDSAVQGVNQARAKHEQALGQLAQARTAPKQTDVIRTSREQALARVEQARAALHAATIQLEYTRVFAPATGRITKKSLEVGSLVQNGAPLMAIVPSDDIWVTANFKETQIAKMDPGDPAEIEVDGLSGEIFRGRVDSVSAATGSTFALLPPDNATGNFTKVVQRISVKIVLDKNQSHVDRLRAGMSVTAVVGTSN